MCPSSQKFSFDRCLESFNRKIKFKRENKVDSAKLFIKKFQKTAFDRFWKEASELVGIYYYLYRLRAGRSLSRFLSIPDSDLMMKMFPKTMDYYL